jgi:cytidylate kinase
MAIIAITQHLGTRGELLGRTLAAQLGYRFMNVQDVINEASKTYNITPQLLVVIDERRPHFWERLKTDTARFIPIFKAVLLKHMAEDRLVVIGRSVAHLMPQHGCGLRLRLVGPMSERIKEVAIEEQLAPAVAERRVRDYDREVRARLQALFEIDIEDPLVHNMTLNTFTTPMPLLVSALAAGVAEIDRTVGPEQWRLMCDAALAAEVRAMLLVHPKIGHAPLEVNCASGAVRVNGPGLVPPWDDLIGDVARQVIGVTSVEVNAEESPAPIRPS